MTLTRFVAIMVLLVLVAALMVAFGPRPGAHHMARDGAAPHGGARIRAA